MWDLQEGCVNKCADKFLKHSERVGARFAELSQNVSLQTMCIRTDQSIKWYLIDGSPWTIIILYFIDFCKDNLENEYNKKLP